MTGRLGEYEIIRELGKGAMGSVFLARDPTLGREVAVKVMTVRSERGLARFAGEAQAVARLQHPNIVKLHEAQLDGPTPYLVMSFVAGESLEARLERGPLGNAAAVALGIELAGALAHAHDHGLLHRDVKPANVLLDGEGVAHLTDFGLAKDLADDREALTLTGQIVGTPAFMAPEQATAERARIGPATDVYGLGATLYAALSGCAPHEESNMIALVAAVAQKESVRLPLLVPDVDPALAAVVHRCLQKDPARRYPDAGALAADLSRVRDGSWRPPRRAGPILFAAGVIGLAIAAGLLAGGVAETPPSPPGQPTPDARTERPRPNETTAPARPPRPWWTGRGWQLHKAWGRDGSPLELTRSGRLWLLTVWRSRGSTSVISVPTDASRSILPVLPADAAAVMTEPDQRRMYRVQGDMLQVARTASSQEVKLSTAWQAALRRSPLRDAGLERGSYVLLVAGDEGAFVGHPHEGPKLVPAGLDPRAPRTVDDRAPAWLSINGRYLLATVFVDGNPELRCTTLHEGQPRRTVPVIARDVRFHNLDTEALVLSEGPKGTILMRLTVPELLPVRRIDVPATGLRFVDVADGSVYVGGSGKLYRWVLRENQAYELPGRFPETWAPSCIGTEGRRLFAAAPDGVYMRILKR